MATEHGNLEKYVLLELSKRKYLRGYNNETGAYRIGTKLIRYGKVGSTDIIAYLAPLGRGVCIEVKIPPDELSDDQIKFREIFSALGVLHYVVYSKKDVDNVMSLLEIEHNKLVLLLSK